MRAFLPVCIGVLALVRWVSLWRAGVLIMAIAR